MRFENMDTPVLETACRLSSLSIVIDDFDSDKLPRNESMDVHFPQLPMEMTSAATCSSTNPQKPYSRQSSDASIKKILEEAEHRKHEFWKLIDEHTAVIESLKKMEQVDGSPEICTIAPPAPASNQTITT